MIDNTTLVLLVSRLRTQELAENTGLYLVEKAGRGLLQAASTARSGAMGEQQSRDLLASVLKDTLESLLPEAVKRLGIRDVVPLQPVRPQFTIKLKVKSFFLRPPRVVLAS